MDTCCTCAAELSSRPSHLSEKSLPEDRKVQCCSRIICGDCLARNQRFTEYCPFCQISTGPSSLPQRLKEPPLYTSVPSTGATTAELSGAPPPYTGSVSTVGKPATDRKHENVEGEKGGAEDTLHFLNHDRDSIASLALRYNVPAYALRRKNKITSDHLLQGRRTILIPGEFYKGGVSLSPRPIEGEEEERRKAKIRRFMTSCKVSDYDFALLYLEQASYDLEEAVATFFEDEAWERAHPRYGDATRKQSGQGRQAKGGFWRRR